MDQSSYAEFVQSATKFGFETFCNQWIWREEIASIRGYDESDPEKNKEVLRKEVLRSAYDEINRSVRSLRVGSGLSQEKFANLFAIPYRTLQTWEQRGSGCPVYLRLLMRQKLGMDLIEDMLGVEK